MKIVLIGIILSVVFTKGYSQNTAVGGTFSQNAIGTESLGVGPEKWRTDTTYTKLIVIDTSNNRLSKNWKYVNGFTVWHCQIKSIGLGKSPFCLFLEFLDESKKAITGKIVKEYYL